jgi:hypothetical protein
VHVIADSAGGAWTFGGSILTFAFPMILFTVVAITLYVVYTKPEFVPGHRAPGLERPVSYTSLPGKPTADREAPAQPAAAEAAGTTLAPSAETPSAETPSAETPAGEAAAGEAAGTEDVE